VAGEYLELDGERVLVSTRGSGRGKTSSLKIEQIATPTERGANLFHVNGARVTRLVVYFDYARALADLGLEE
jgi:hypothetical protein